jgi:NADPH:quinone reductase-like Zn-dependent oxidoreductase
VGLRKPEDPRLGADVAGVVVAVGKNVTEFKPGDEVFGTSGGAFAEYAPVNKKRAAAKPANLTFEQAAAVPVAAVTALQALRDNGHEQPGQKVLINGASGGVGTFAVQIAKSFGAEVTAVCSTRNLEMVRSLGADHVIDYTKEDVLQGAQHYDVILDNVGNLPMLAARHILKPKGIFVMVGGGPPDAGSWIGPMWGPVRALLLSPFVSQNFSMILANITKDDLSLLKDLLETKKITPVIDRTYPLSETAAAIRYLEAGHARGKVIITVGP